MYDGVNFTDLYNQHRNKFVNWAKQWCGLDEGEIVDAYQDACVILWQKLEGGNLVLTARPATFLFGIGRNMLRERLRDKRRTPAPLPEGFQIEDAAVDELVNSPEEDIIKTQNLDCLIKILGKLGENSAAIIRLTYYDNKDSKQIAEIAGYASGDVVRQMRRRCMAQLRELYEKHCL